MALLFIKFNQACIKNNIAFVLQKILKHKQPKSQNVNYLHKRTHCKLNLSLSFNQHLDSITKYGVTKITRLIQHTYEWLKHKLQNIQNRHNKKMPNLIPKKPTPTPAYIRIPREN